MLRFLKPLGFLKDGQLDIFYVFMTLRALGLGLVGVFIPIFLWKNNYELWQIFGFFALLSAFYLLAMLLLPQVLRGRSHRLLVGISIPILAATFYGLTILPEYPALFFALPLGMALSKLLFEIAFYTNIARVADDGFIGRQTGVLYVLNSLAGVVTPFIGAVIATEYGFPVLFFVAIGVLLLSLLLFCLLRTYPISCDFSVREMREIIRDDMPRQFTLMHIGYGAEYAVHVVAWPLFVFIVLDNLEAFGALISIGTFVTMFVQYLNGNLFDAGRGKAVVWFSTVSFAVVGALRALVVLAPLAPIAAGVHVVGKVSQGAAHMPFAQSNITYTKHCQIPAVFSASMLFIWHAARLVTLLVLMALSFLLPLKAFFFVAFLLGALIVLNYLRVNRLPKVTFPTETQ